MIVDRITNLLLIKAVRFVAPTTERCEWQNFAGGHVQRLIQCTLKVGAGSALTLLYPGWTKLRIGQTVELDEIRRHPFGPRGQRARVESP